MKIKLYKTIWFNYIKLNLTLNFGFHVIEYIRYRNKMHTSIEYH